VANIRTQIVIQVPTILVVSGGNVFFPNAIDFANAIGQPIPWNVTTLMTDAVLPLAIRP
jgi:hypothetical protein